MKLVALIGSIRKNSYNHQIANFVKKRYEESVEIEKLNITDLPYFDQDIEEHPPETVKQFKHHVKQADGVLIFTPEYNHSVPGVLKNALDWLSRVDRVLTGKPVLIIGASMGMLGTVRCQMHLRQILAAPGLSAKVLPGNEVLIGNVHEKLDRDGHLTDESTVQFLDKVVENYLQFSKQMIREQN
ncbi:NADPH-dependent FMN reductase [Evansella halocellulosilytica]|uniref:NADPH-dependent FMN reductase n=1 Tax=Evansella halocellulosilytica TaxID=2011013 RepID=UPI000BB68A87|nr:NADPH-dependent FMN reductase [Evansella halocellulosilytica]